MNAHLEIRRNADGVIRKLSDSWMWEGNDFVWSRGHFACDCNRLAFFRWAGREPDNGTRPCGLGAYSVRLTDQTGTEFYADADWHRPVKEKPSGD